MKNLGIPSTVALVLGVVMVFWGAQLHLHQNDLAQRTTGEFIIYASLIVGGVLIALIAAFGVVQSSRKYVGEGLS